MNRYMPWLAAVAAGLVAGLLIAGASTEAVVAGSVALVCPLMMIAMMFGMGHMAHGIRERRSSQPVDAEAPGQREGEHHSI